MAPAQENRIPGDPLESQDGRITPKLNALFARSGSAPFYFVVWPPMAPASMKPEASVTVTKDGQNVAQVRLDVPSADENGAYRFMGRIALAGLEPGQYEVMVTVSQGRNTARTDSLFHVE